MHRISPNFIYAFILTRSTVGLLAHLFSNIFTRVMALDFLKKCVSTQYFENKRTDFDKTILTRSTLGLLAVIFSNL